ncbi:LysR family transcriptional regulator [Asticcacaulis excentricus]|uniref:LysR family transcriptional regulator n=1 Tax=Asticcacaulis excentricus TaxID=78587 RepID=UPI000F841BB7|nr:LysR family transcriptional regulator [Asticcacaulis excentricus]
MDTLVSVHVFAAVAETRSFTAAANRLGLSTAMTSKHIKHLEVKIGARLLNRTSRKVSLTEAGTIYLESVQSLIEGLEEAEARISQTSIKPSGRLKLSVPVWMATPQFAHLIRMFHDQCPEVVLELDLSARMVNLVEEGFDLAIRAATSFEPGLIGRKLGDVSFKLVAAPAFLEKHGRPQTLADLNGAPYLAYTQVARDGKVRLPTSTGTTEIAFRPVLLSGNESLLMFAACEGLGFSLMPAWLVDEQVHSGNLEHVLPDLARPVAPLYVVYPDRSYLPAKVRYFLDFLVKAVAAKQTFSPDTIGQA